MSDEDMRKELDAIRAHGLTVREAKEKAREPVQPQQEPWAEGHPVILVERDATLLNKPAICSIAGPRGENYDKEFTACGIVWLRRGGSAKGGEFARAESVEAFFDAGLAGQDKIGRLRLLTVRSMEDFQPVLPYDAARVNRNQSFDSFHSRLYPEVVMNRLSMDSAAKVPLGGHRELPPHTRIEDLPPCVVGVRTDLLAAPEGQILWIRLLPRNGEAE